MGGRLTINKLNALVGGEILPATILRQFCTFQRVGTFLYVHTVYAIMRSRN